MCAGGVVSRGGGPAALPGELGSAGGVVSGEGGPAALPEKERSREANASCPDRWGELGSAGGEVSGWGLVGRDCGGLAGVSMLCVGWQLRQSQWGGMWCLCGIPEHLSV